MTTPESGLTPPPGSDDLLELPEPDLDADRLWYAVQTKSRQEKALDEHMQAKGITTFLPLVSKIRTYGKRQRPSDLPLFPGYVFLFGEKVDVYDADRTRHVARFIEVEDQASFYGEINAIQRVVAAGNKLDPYPALVSGTHVEVRAGGLKGMKGIVEKKTKSLTRLILQIEIVGQAVSMEIDGSLLEPI